MEFLEFIEKARSKHGEAYDYNKVVWVSRLCKVEIVCKKHGSFFQMPKSHLTGKGCAACGYERNGTKSRQNLAAVRERMRIAGVPVDKVDLSEYTSMHSRIRAVCDIHGEFRPTVSNLLKGCWCAKCGKLEAGNKRGAPTLNKLLNKLNEKNLTLVSAPNNVRANSRVTIKCELHGEFRTTVDNIVFSNTSCPKCAIIAAKLAATKGFEEVEALAAARGYGLLRDGYQNSKSRITAICPTHGEFETTANYLQSGNGCPRCVNKISKGEQELFEFVRSLAVDAEQTNKTLIGPKHIDIYVPSKRLGIEYHGLYYHAGESKKEGCRLKWKLSEAAGVKLIQIFEDEWLFDKEIVKARLSAMLGVCNLYDARKCSVVRLNNSEAKVFMENHHSQHHVQCSDAYGLTSQGELVAVATFGKSRRWGKHARDGWEVLRYASSGRVRGGFTKLFSAFVRNTNPAEVVSYCDLRWGDGSVYKAAGFSLDGITEPDYWWADTSRYRRYSRYSMQKKRLSNNPLTAKFFSSELSESQICEAAGLVKIYGVGNQRWVWRAK